MTLMRLNRYLARRGVASRRGADILIGSGRVTVDGVAAAVGTSIDADGARVEVDHRAVRAAPATLTLMLNKPAGVVTTRRDDRGRPTVMELIGSGSSPPGRRGGAARVANTASALVPVGRLDVDSRGLLLLSSDGELVHRLTHPRFGVTKRYRVTLDRPPNEAELRRMVDGVRLQDGWARALRAGRAGRPNVLEVEMGEGRNREVRRLCAALGLEVSDLVRVGLGPLRLGSLEEGSHRPLTPGELRQLQALVGLSEPAAGVAQLGPRRSPPGPRRVVAR